MTLPRLEAVLAHWEKVPPLAHSVAAIAKVIGVDYKKGKGAPGAPPKTRQEEMGNVQELFELLGANGFGTEKPAWLTTAAKT